MAKDKSATVNGYTCPVCLSYKAKGLLLCLPCHHRNAREDGTYPVHIEAMIDQWDNLAGGPNDVQRTN